MNGSHRGWRHPAVAAFVVAGLLIVVAVGVRGRSWAGGSSSTRHVPPVFWDYVFSAGVVLWLVLGCYAMYAYMAMQRREGGRKPNDVRRVVVAVAIFVLTIVAVSQIAPRLRQLIASSGHGTERHGVVRAGPRLPATKTPPPRRQSQFRWTAAAGALALLAAIAAGSVIYRRRRIAASAARRKSAAIALAQVLDDTLDDLRNERDPRRAVIAAYARMERTLAAYGLPRVPSEAPEEYLRRMLADLEVTGASARRLTALFERAKFSPHEVDAAMKDDAIDALVTLRGELEHAA